MPSIISNDTYSISGLTPVPVVASFNQRGEMLPLYVKILGEQYKILSAKQKHETRIGCTMECVADLKTRRLTFNLEYRYEIHTWLIDEHLARGEAADA